MERPPEGRGKNAMLVGLKVQEATVYHTLALGNPVQKEGFSVDLQIKMKRLVFFA